MAPSIIAHPAHTWVRAREFHDPCRSSATSVQWGAAKSTQRKHTRERQSAPPKKTLSNAESAAALQQSILLLRSVQTAVTKSIGTVCSIEVTLPSSGSQDIAPSEQGVLSRALKAILIVGSWLGALSLSDRGANHDSRE